MSGRSFNGQAAANLGLANASVPLRRLRDEVQALALELAQKNPVVLRAATIDVKHCAAMSRDDAEDSLSVPRSGTRS